MKRAVISLKGPVRGVTIACVSGTAWITQAGDRHDYIVPAGTDFAVPGDGNVVVQLLKDAGVAVRLPDSHPGRLQRRPSTECCPGGGRS